MRQAAFCGLGQAAPNPVMSCIKHFRSEFEDHCAGKPCSMLGGGRIRMEITIDGRPLTLEKPVSILEAARLAGVDIPTLCWHPRVSVLGACRLCMIEVVGMNRLLAACTTRVADKMEILTDTPALRKVRQTMLELLLCQHPMDCPTCVKGGACELQALAYKWSAPVNRFPENPGAYPPVDVSPFIERDSRKCVLCRRCVRVCHEVRGVTVLGAMHRGHLKEIGTYFAQPLDRDFRDPYNCEFCGACIDICPVGALNSRQHKFRARTWEGAQVPTVCPFCSVGCLISLQVKENELVQSRPRGGVNNHDQACFRGRFAVDYVNSPQRVTGPLLRRDGELVPVDAGHGDRRAGRAGAARDGGHGPRLPAADPGGDRGRRRHHDPALSPRRRARGVHDGPQRRGHPPGHRAPAPGAISSTRTSSCPSART